MTFGELLDQLKLTMKELAYNMQKNISQVQSTRKKRSTPGSNVIILALAIPPAMTAQVYENDRQSKFMMITSKIKQLKLPKILLDSGFLGKLLSQINMIKMST